MANLEEIKRKEKLKKADIDIDLDYIQRYVDFQCPYCQHIGLKRVVIENKKKNNSFISQLEYICPKCGHIFYNLKSKRLF